MTPLEFMYWLKGYFDISRNSKLEPINLDIIKKQMEEVFSLATVTPKYVFPSVWQTPEIGPSNSFIPNTNQEAK